MTGLVLEGGTFRPIFSCGVMDALLDAGIEFDYVIGESAGITDGMSYVSRQAGRNLKLLLEQRHNKRYVGFRNFFTDKSLFGLKYAYDYLGNEGYPFDWETFQKSRQIVRVAVTNARTGLAEYLNGKDLDRCFTMLKATCALPRLFPPIPIGDNLYYDGGIADPIPVRQAEKDGCDRLLILSTRTKGYRKSLTGGMKLLGWSLNRRFPRMNDALRMRPQIYNEEVDYCEQLEKTGRAILFRPSEEVQIRSMEKDLDKIQRAYRYGYDLATERLEDIKKLCMN